MVGCDFGGLGLKLLLSCLIAEQFYEGTQALQAKKTTRKQDLDSTRVRFLLIRGVRTGVKKPLKQTVL